MEESESIEVLCRVSWSSVRMSAVLHSLNTSILYGLVCLWFVSSESFQQAKRKLKFRLTILRITTTLTAIHPEAHHFFNDVVSNFRNQLISGKALPTIAMHISYFRRTFFFYKTKFKTAVEALMPISTEWISPKSEMLIRTSCSILFGHTP